MSSNITTRSRSTDLGVSWRKRYVRSSKSSPWILKSGESPRCSVKGLQVTVSEGHPWKGSSRQGDIGGGFSTNKQSAVGFTDAVRTVYSSDGLEKEEGPARVCVGPITATGGSSTSVSIEKDSSFGQTNKDLNSLGAVAIAQCSPTNPVANAATFLAETYREGLPSLPGIQSWERRAKLLVGAAGEFLNTEFGWLPLLHEMRSTANLVAHASTVLKQFKRDEGKLVRRRYYFPVASTSSSKVLNSVEEPTIGPNRIASYFLNGEKGTLTLQETTERRTWFSGAFRYHLPVSDSTEGIHNNALGARDFLQIVGTSLTPEVLWELAPWSWAVDYFSNAQQVIQNLQNMEIYGLFMEYGYLMDETIKKHIYTFKKTSKEGVDLNPPPYIETFVSKNRVKANPYGFGISFNELSPLQVAILAAAGITSLL